MASVENPFYYSVCLNVTGRRCVVIGGGEIAQRKVESLLEASALVDVVTPRAVAPLHQMAQSGQIGLSLRGYCSHDLEGAILAYAATDDDGLHKRIAADAKARGVFLNVVDRPQWCDFIVPSIARRGDLVVAVSTSGRSPAMARRVRQDIEAMLGPEYECVIDLFARLRRRLSDLKWSFDRRKQVFDDLLDGQILEAMREGDLAEVDRLLSRCTGDAVTTSGLGWGG